MASGINLSTTRSSEITVRFIAMITKRIVGGRTFIDVSPLGQARGVKIRRRTQVRDCPTDGFGWATESSQLLGYAWLKTRPMGTLSVCPSTRTFRFKLSANTRPIVSSIGCAEGLMSAEPIPKNTALPTRITVLSFKRWISTCCPANLSRNWARFATKKIRLLKLHKRCLPPSSLLDLKSHLLPPSIS